MTLTGACRWCSQLEFCTGTSNQEHIIDLRNEVEYLVDKNTKRR
jgi:hypothetical protein